MTQTISTFKKVLVANRGEIACRVMRTLKKLDIDSVALFSDADKNAQHVLNADESVWIGPSPAAESYLIKENIIAAAKQTGADAIHPGYGFLSENAEFAALCEANNIQFMGPPASAITAMGSKAEAKKIMGEAEVPLVPGYHGENQDADFLLQQAEIIGFPVLLKASLGGGGKGMRLVEAAAEFHEALAACKREALSSFGDDHVLIEKYVVQPRHVEIQVFADSHGNAVYLFERDCSIQRRHQKVVEEAPAPGMTESLRKEMGEAAVRAAKAIGYVGAGTIEFLLAADGAFYFMEMNTRLQVEHPVTELITGEDLVEWQVRVAEGYPLPKQQDELSIQGHALEVRIYAEDPDNEFLPSTGKIDFYRTPKDDGHIRIDSGVVEGDEISVFYDPMIAKLIVWDHSRTHALHRLEKALTQFHISGVCSNIPFLSRVVGHPAFKQAQLSTHFIEDYQTEVLPPKQEIEAFDFMYAALFQFLSKESTGPSVSSGAANDPWGTLTAWQLNALPSQTVLFLDGEEVVPVEVMRSGSQYLVSVKGQSLEVAANLSNGELRLTGKTSAKIVCVDTGSSITLFYGGKVSVVPKHLMIASQSGSDSENHLRAPMNGRIIQVLVEPGQTVEDGDLLVTMEAMKMEHSIKAHSAGEVSEVFFSAGDLVSEGDELIELAVQELEEA